MGGNQRRDAGEALAVVAAILLRVLHAPPVQRGIPRSAVELLLEGATGMEAAVRCAPRTQARSLVASSWITVLSAGRMTNRIDVLADPEVGKKKRFM